MSGRGEAWLVAIPTTGMPWRLVKKVGAVSQRRASTLPSNIGVPFSALADLPPVVDMPRFPGANEPCRLGILIILRVQPNDINDLAHHR
jgi:hypothetical protein